MAQFNCCAQSFNYSTYRTNGYQLLASIDSDYKFVLHLNKIKTLTETRYNYDSLGSYKDSSILNYYKFDSAGRVIEARYNYYGKNHQTQYSLYMPDGSRRDSLVPPRNAFEPLDGFYFNRKFAAYCEYSNDQRDITDISIQIETKGPVYTMHYTYQKWPPVDEYDIEGNMVIQMLYSQNNTPVYQHHIYYQK